MAMLLSEKQIAQLKRRVTETPHPREMVLDVLHAIQEAKGWVSDEGIELAAAILGLTPLQVEEIATFYDKIYRRPVGRKVIHVCDSICCWSRGSEAIMLRLQQLLGIAPGETTADGMFTLLPTCCLGACGDAPAVRIGKNLYGRVTPEDLAGILEGERTEAGP
ncbi:MAG: NADH-quinone oxidoreductase subunit NuoE [Syntrophotalea acetylenica]|uniref:NADH-quinone oxidoreductase subunit NuoE n=1 Tax=Syntrophotalea TaxID=2812025 RepID=UPI002A36F8F8|nr:NADH-quinone oxidoreductase subunit NuoE [Syntrophotalea acetylenica]MDD4457188.1 NADH-quinone oxidoreductase subunit NuoE [Syntrophotalea acetylenica]MDY0262807.1 NADH-quinone oxidoreductase subunit NuoE [Syntrophotalea acetylenica]